MVKLNMIVEQSISFELTEQDKVEARTALESYANFASFMASAEIQKIHHKNIDDFFNTLLNSIDCYIALNTNEINSPKVAPYISEGIRLALFEIFLPKDELGKYEKKAYDLCGKDNNFTENPSPRYYSLENEEFSKRMKEEGVSAWSQKYLDVWVGTSLLPTYEAMCQVEKKLNAFRRRLIIKIIHSNLLLDPGIYKLVYEFLIKNPIVGEIILEPYEYTEKEIDSENYTIGIFDLLLKSKGSVENMKKEQKIIYENLSGFRQQLQIFYGSNGSDPQPTVAHKKFNTLFPKDTAAGNIEKTQRAFSCFQLGISYYTGLGDQKDILLAVENLEKSAINALAVDNHWLLNRSLKLIEKIESEEGVSSHKEKIIQTRIRCYQALMKAQPSFSYIAEALTFYRKAKEFYRENGQNHVEVTKEITAIENTEKQVENKLASSYCSLGLNNKEKLREYFLKLAFAMEWLQAAFHLADYYFVKKQKEIVCGYLKQAFVKAKNNNDEVMLLSVVNKALDLSSKNHIYKDIKSELTNSLVEYLAAHSDILPLIDIFENNFHYKIKTEKNQSISCNLVGADLKPIYDKIFEQLEKENDAKKLQRITYFLDLLLTIKTQNKQEDLLLYSSLPFFNNNDSLLDFFGKIINNRKIYEILQLVSIKQWISFLFDLYRQTKNISQEFEQLKKQDLEKCKKIFDGLIRNIAAMIKNNQLSIDKTINILLHLDKNEADNDFKEIIDKFILAISGKVIMHIGDINNFADNLNLMALLSAAKNENIKLIVEKSIKNLLKQLLAYLNDTKDITLNVALSYLQIVNKQLSSGSKSKDFEKICIDFLLCMPHLLSVKKDTAVVTAQDFKEIFCQICDFSIPDNDQLSKTIRTGLFTRLFAGFMEKSSIQQWQELLFAMVIMAEKIKPEDESVINQMLLQMREQQFFWKGEKIEKLEQISSGLKNENLINAVVLDLVKKSREHEENKYFEEQYKALNNNGKENKDAFDKIAGTKDSNQTDKFLFNKIFREEQQNSKYRYFSKYSLWNPNVAQIAIDLEKFSKNGNRIAMLELAACYQTNYGIDQAKIAAKIPNFKNDRLACWWYLRAGIDDFKDGVFSKKARESLEKIKNSNIFLFFLIDNYELGKPEEVNISESLALCQTILSDCIESDSISVPAKIALLIKLKEFCNYFKSNFSKENKTLLEIEKSVDEKIDSLNVKYPAKIDLNTKMSSEKFNEFTTEEKLDLTALDNYLLDQQNNSQVLPDWKDNQASQSSSDPFLNYFNKNTVKPEEDSKKQNSDSNQSSTYFVLPTIEISAPKIFVASDSKTVTIDNAPIPSSKAPAMDNVPIPTPVPSAPELPSEDPIPASPALPSDPGPIGLNSSNASNFVAENKKPEPENKQQESDFKKVTQENLQLKEENQKLKEELTDVKSKMEKMQLQLDQIQKRLEHQTSEKTESSQKILESMGGKDISAPLLLQLINLMIKEKVVEETQKMKTQLQQESKNSYAKTPHFFQGEHSQVAEEPKNQKNESVAQKEALTRESLGPC